MGEFAKQFNEKLLKEKKEEEKRKAGEREEEARSKRIDDESQALLTQIGALAQRMAEEDEVLQAHMRKWLARTSPYERRIGVAAVHLLLVYESARSSQFNEYHGYSVRVTSDWMFHLWKSDQWGDREIKFRDCSKLARELITSELNKMTTEQGLASVLLKPVEIGRSEISD